MCVLSIYMYIGVSLMSIVLDPCQPGGMFVHLDVQTFRIMPLSNCAPEIKSDSTHMFVMNAFLAPVGNTYTCR